MAENKKSVLLYCDIIHTVEELSDEEAGKLFKHYLRYINDLEPAAPDKLTQIVFEPIKQNLKRDLIKWEKVVESKVRAGQISAEKRKQMSTRVESAEQKPTESTVIVTVKDTVIVKDINKEPSYAFDSDNFKIKYHEWLEFRKQTKKPVKQKSVDQQMKFLGRFTEATAIKILENSIMNGWQGLFEIKDNLSPPVIKSDYKAKMPLELNKW